VVKRSGALLGRAAAIVDVLIGIGAAYRS